MVEKKRATLYEADIELYHLKHLIRLSFELKYISPKGYEVSCNFLTEIGKMLGAWIKTLKEKDKH